MSILKQATFQILSASMAGQTERINRTAHRAEFQYDPKPGFLYVRSRAISSRINENFDGFPAEEIIRSYASFNGRPVFVNHHNENHRRARGVIIDSALHEDVNPDGSPDVWVEVLMEVDAVKFPKLAKAILAGHIERTSMGCDVEYSECTFCGNKAHTPQQYCAHIPRLKGRRIRRKASSGSYEDVLVAEMCYGITFFENSLLVEEPADPTAYFLGVDARGLSMAASKTADQAYRYTPGDWTSWDRDSTPDFVTKKHAHDSGAHDGAPEPGCPACDSKTASAFPGAGAQVYTNEVGEPIGWDYPGQDETYGADPYDDYDYGQDRGYDDEDTYLAEHERSEHDPIGQRDCPMCQEEIEEGNRNGSTLQYTDPQDFTTPNENGWTASLLQDMIAYEEMNDRFAKLVIASSADSDYLVKDTTVIAGPADQGTPEHDALQARADSGEGQLMSAEIVGITVGLTDGRPAPDYTYMASRTAGDDACGHYQDDSTEPCKNCGYALGSHSKSPGVRRERGTGWEMDVRTSSFGGQRLASMRHEAIGEVVAPPEVDTLRATTCPICGSDAFNGDECPVCLYIQPPDMYMDPDPSVAQQTDLRGNSPEAQDATPVGDDLLAGDLKCDTCGGSVPDAEAQAPVQPQPSAQTQMAQQPSAAPASPVAAPPQPVENQVPPDEPPAASNGAPAPPPPAAGPTPSLPAPADKGDPEAKPPAGEFLPKPGTEDDPSKDKKEHAADDSKPEEKDNPFKKKDDASTDPAKPDDHDTPPPAHEGDTCPICGDGTLTKADAATFNKDVGDPTAPAKDDKNPFAKGDDSDKKDSDSDDSDKKDDDSDDDKDKKKDGPPWEKADSSHEGVMSNQRSMSMAPRSSLRVIAAQQAQLRAQASTLARQQAQIDWLKRAVEITAEAAGIKPRQADAANPAQPIPSPASQGAPSTTEQARTPDGRDSVDSIGASPVAGTAADGTDTVDTVGGVVADTPYNVTQDVTAPISGTEDRAPLDQVRTLPEIQFGNPNVPDTAFPLQGGFAERARVSSRSEGRTFASIRLAKLRQTAGLVEAGADELIVAAAINDDKSLTDHDIAREIETLSAVKQATRTAPRAEGARRLVPRSAGATRTAPSLQGGMPHVGSSGSYDDDAFAFTD